MSAPSRPRIIVTLPARDLRSAHRQASEARDAGADLAEVRFDRWPGKGRSRMDGLFPSPVPLIATLRSRAEGGEGPDDPTERARWIARARRLPFSFVDVEQARDPIPPTGSADGPRTIVSHHLPDGSGAAEVATDLDRPVPAGAIHKLVVRCSVGELLDAVVPLLGARSAPFIVHTTGPSGPLLRAWAPRFGMAGVYAAPPRGAGGAEPPVETSQLPVDRIRPWIDAGAGAPLFAVVGRPVAHSRSPDLHHQWMRAHGRHGLYVALEFATDDELRAALPALAAGGFRGWNVTHPFKTLAFGLAGQRSEAAERCGCANTLTATNDGLIADNTDLPAMRRRLDELEAEGRWDGAGALVIGAGGAARAALAALEDRGARAEILARNPARAADLARAFHAHPVGSAGPTELSLAVHATTVGRDGTPLAVDLGRRRPRGGYLLDYVYAPTDGSLERRARAAGMRYEDGTRLLVYSAAESYRGWWGDAPSEAEIATAVREIGR